MSKVDRSHRSLTAKSNTRKVTKVNSDCEDRPKAATPDEGPFPWEEQARPSGSEPAQNADFVVEVSSVILFCKLQGLGNDEAIAPTFCCSHSAVLQDERMAEVLDSVMACMVITNPLQTGHPIVFATKGFAEMVGYHREALLGKSIFQVTNSPKYF